MKRNIKVLFLASGMLTGVVGITSGYEIAKSSKRAAGTACVSGTAGVCEPYGSGSACKKLDEGYIGDCSKTVYAEET